MDSILSGTGSISLALTLSNEKLWLTNIFREIFFIGFSIAYWSMLYMVKFKDKNHVMEKEQLRSIAKTLELENKYISAENAYLQNQISPHLLFNSLNFIYNSIHKVSERAGKGVMLLSEIMRYSLVSSEDNRTVLLSQEMEQAQKLIDLSHLRFEQQLFISFRKKGRLKDVKILPLIIITLVENMIKHGDLGEAGEPGHISLTYGDGVLVFKTSNKKRLSSPYPKGGIGLRNIEKRLGNYYPDRYKLEISETNNNFAVSLTLNL
ncbi:histidine kinase [Mucilaginibacter sp. BJC16-A38]|uniref:sensor histidine kinase n=1 Tax=Mucilaginibacter phenanthrenivorans TaxID=1234842 RepID=UPI00215826ED|nr:histidine kinase [Mucilaginibacter phenanthrenivorans]MCR8560357.1 histidine kinase [Mucilaginibacter phenanthrenivorans]